MRPVVAVVHRHQVPGHVTQTGISSRISTAVLLQPDELNSRITPGNTFDYGARIVHAAVVDYDHLEITPGLLQDAVDDPLEHIAGIVGGQDHRHLQVLVRALRPGV